MDRSDKALMDVSSRGSKERVVCTEAARERFAFLKTVFFFVFAFKTDSNVLRIPIDD